MNGRRMMWISGWALCAWTLAYAGSASADAGFVSHQLTLPLDGRPVDLAPLAEPFDERVRFVVSGAVWSDIDGASYDAFSRRVGDRVHQEDGAFLTLPPGSRVLASDPLAHRYTIEMPARPVAPISFATSKLVARYLLPRSEVAARLTGDLTVEVLAPAASLGPMRAPVIEPPPHQFDGGDTGFWLALITMPLPLLLLLRRTPEEHRLMRRIERAVQAIDSEARRLGPAFHPVGEAARMVIDAAGQIGGDVKRARAAFRRTAWVQSSAAAVRRQEVQDREQELVSRLSRLVEQLEVLATELTTVDIDGASGRVLSRRLRDLTEQLEEAVAAQGEAERALLTDGR